MSVLLVSRGSMSGGNLIGHCLGRTLGCPYVTREELMARVNAHGEIATRVLAGLDRAAKDYRTFSEVRRPYKVLMRLALLEYARGGSMAYFGYSGHLLLPPVAHFVRVRLSAPMVVRIQTTRDRLKVSEAQAIDYIERVDEDRTRWARFMYGADIRDPKLYDLVINLRRISIEGACALLHEIVRRDDFQPTPASLEQVEDLYLAAQVEAAVLARESTRLLEVGARAHAGEVVLQGPYLEDEELEQVVAAAKSVPGVASLEYQPGYAPDVECPTDGDPPPRAAASAGEGGRP